MRNLSNFSSNLSLKEKILAGVWRVVNQLLMKSIFCPNKLRKYFLILHGARIGARVIIRSGVRVQFPWNLVIGDDCWIGEEVWFINHEKVAIGSDVCISQRSIICSGGHDYRSSSLEYAHKPVVIKDGAWVCLDAKVLPGVTIGECSVVSASEIVRKSLDDYSMLINGQVRKIEPPK